MIIQLLLDCIYGLFSLLTTPINIPQLPDTVYTYVDTLKQYLGVGVGILSNYAPMAYIVSLWGVIIAVDVGIKLYQFVMWILKKIPMLDVK